MKTKLIALFVSLVLVLVLSACGGAATPTAAPAGDGGDAATAAPSGDTSGGTMGSAVFNNTGSIDICELYLSAVSKNDWGPNQLPDGQKIVAGDKFTLNNVPVGQYDAKAVGCDGTAEAVIQLEVK